MTTEAHTTEPRSAAQEACDELAAALAEAGIVLPSLGVDLVTYSSQRPSVLIELGRCNVATARRLVAALAKAAR
ncbi:hypothetical protein SSP35_09_01520 [Streptomyces sp. NBRC 110611]|uniref:hypothetical protein n=1 Tax=Streptomyces sp. NBRC 110611 TaxID=1621259 RepID=UPI00082B185D|nr:hypothetical protein [Streptomyces sp. NBRC 110611]GAU68908.1 hypothetical protein SSP35_09_01520 [Streptomyces sp. NBRC 110611]